MHSFTSFLKRLGSLFLVGIVVCSGHAQTISPEDLLFPTDVTHEIFGFNGEYMVDGCFDSDDPYSNPQQPYNSFYLDQGCRQIVSDMNPAVLRFPGGTTANFYHFNGNGFGIDIGETIGNAIGPIDLTIEPLIPENYIKIFADLALQTQSKVLFTINIYTHFRAGGSVVTDPNNAGYRWRFKENMDALQYLVDRGVDLIGVELGNELYRYSEFTSIFTYGTAIDKYLVLAETYSDSIKARFPTVKTGVPVAIHLGWANQGWNEKMQTANFADGFVIHEYERRVNDVCGLIEDREAYFDCARANIDHFFETDLESIIDTYVQLYPGDKELWLTEWGMSKAEKVANTFFDATFVFHYWNKIMELEKKYPGKIPFAHRHNLIAQGYSYSGFSQRFLGDAPSLNYNGKSIRASAYPSLMMSPIYDGSHQFIGKTTLSGCDAWIYTQGNTNYSIAIINDTSAQRTINIADVQQALNTQGLEFEKFSSLHADHFYDAAGINYFESEALGLPNELTYRKDVPATSSVAMTLEDMSLNLIRVKIGEPAPFSIDTFYTSANDCQVVLTWTVSSDAPTIGYVLHANDLPIDTLPSLGFANIRTYEYPLLWAETGDVTFNVIAIETGEVLDARTAAPLSMDCAAPELPSFSSIDAIASAECNAVVSWTVQNDLAGTTYNVTGRNEQSAVVFTASVASNGSGQYSAQMTPSANGPLYFQVDLAYGSAHTESSAIAPVEISCVPAPPPAVFAFSATENANCDHTLQWSVSNETTGSTYLWYQEYGPDVELLSIVTAAANEDTAHYQLPITPPFGGLFNYYMLHIVDGVLVDTLSDLQLNVTCLDPLVPSLAAVDLAIVPDACVAAFTWLVENDQVNAEYLLMGSINGAPMTEIATVPSDEGGVYLFPYVPAANEWVSMQVFIRYNGEIADSSNVLDLSIDCVVAPAPEMAFFSLQNTGNCSWNISWLVSNERANTTYKILLSNNGGTPTVIREVTSLYNTPIGGYEQLWQPQTNGTHQLYVEMWLNGSLLQTTEMLTAEVACVAAQLESFTLQGLAGCSYQLDWETSSEVENASYQLYGGLTGAPMALVHSEDATSNAESAAYSYVFTPAQNGTYQFQLHRLEGGNLLATTPIIIEDVSCIPAVVSDLSLSDNGDCSFAVQWEVAHESPDASYDLVLFYENGDSEVVGTYLSAGQALQASYQHSFTPGANASYGFQLIRYENGLQVASSALATIEVSCLPPAFVQFTAVETGNCQFSIQWEVTDEYSGGTYTLFKDGEAVAIIAAQGLPQYNYLFTPAVNGVSNFTVEHSADGQIALSAGPLAITTNCIPAVVSDLSLSDNGDCSFVVQWEVAHESTDASYDLVLFYENGDSEIVGTYLSAGQALQASYQHSFTPGANASYGFQLVRYENGLQVSTSAIATIEVSCLPPAFGPFTAVETGNCQYSIQWEVTNEYSGGTYALFNDGEAVANIAAQGLPQYSYLFTPAVNGVSNFTVEHSADGQIALSAGPLAITTNCVAAAIESVNIIEDGCVYTIDWTVSNEDEGASYRVYIEPVGESPVLLAEVNAEGPLTTAVYSAQYTPSNNGTYGVQLYRYENGNLVATTAQEYISVTCIAAVLSPMTLQEDSPCVYSLNWEVSNEANDAAYEVLMSENGGAMSSFGQIPGQGNVATATYQLPFTPSSNSTFAFQLIRYESGEITHSGQVITIGINCLTASLDRMYVVDEGDCSSTLYWEVSNENPASTYVLKGGLRGLPPTAIATVSSSGYQTAATYSYLFEPEVNGTYDFILDRLEGAAVATLETAIEDVNCIAAGFVSANIVDDGTCAYDLHWTISNETDNAVYTVYRQFNGGPYLTEAVIPSSGSASIANYTWEYLPEENGSNVFFVVRSVNGVNAGNSQIIVLNVSCFSVPVATFTSAEIVPAGECFFNVEWSVADESTDAMYWLMMSYETEGYQIYTPVDITTDGELVSYSIPFNPTMNGLYRFRVDRRENGVTVSSSATMFADIGCVPAPAPTFESYAVNQQENCSLYLQWTVSNETENASYVIRKKHPSSAYTELGTIQSDGNLPMATYSFQYNPTFNAIYLFDVVRYEGTEIAGVSDLLTFLVECVPPPSPVVETASVQISETCSLVVDWTVANETSMGIYYLTVRQDGMTVATPIIAGNGLSPVANYQYTYVPESNGSFSVAIARAEGVAPDTIVAVPAITVTCLPETAVGIPTATGLPDCSVSITWDVTDEQPGADYTVFAQWESGIETVIGTAVSTADGNVSYEVTFTPDVNGFYDFFVVRSQDGETLETPAATILVDCIVNDPPSISLLTAEVDGNCRIVLQWTTDAQTAGTQFLLKGGVDGGAHLPIATIESDGVTGSSSYTYVFDAPNNGTYSFSVELWEGSDFLSTTSTVTAQVNCLVTPTFTLAVNPTLTFGRFNIMSTTNMPMTANIRIINTFSGATSYNAMTNLSEGFNRISLNMDELPNTPVGLYQIIVTVNGVSKYRTLLYLG